MLSSAPTTTRRTLGLVLLAWSGGVAGALFASGMSVVTATIVSQALPTLCGLLAAYLCRHERDSWLKRVSLVLEGMSALGAIGLAGTFAAYSLASMSGRMAGALLASADARLGFDWIALYGWVSTHRWAQMMGRLCYHSIFFSPLAICIVLGIGGRERRLHCFIIAFALALGATIAIFPFFPAHSALAFHIGRNPPYMPGAGLSYVAYLDALRSGAIRVIDPAQLIGLVTFPSFHASCAVLFAWAAWPVRSFRWPMLVINTGMLAATPIEGAHYFVDLLGGALTAVGAILVAGRLCRRPMPADDGAPISVCVA